MKKILIILMTFSILFVSACGKKKEEVKEEEPTVVEVEEENVVAEQIIDGILFKDASVVVVNGITEFRVTLENTITTVRRISKLTVNFKDEDGIIIQTLHYYNFNSLKKGDTQDLTWSLSKDLKDAKKIEYEIEL